MAIHNLIKALALRHLYGTGVRPVLQIESQLGEDLTSHPNFHFFHGKISIKGDTLSENFPSDFFGTFHLQEAIYRDFNQKERDKILEVTAELVDSNLVIFYYVSESF
ncbi:TPA: hypothetical protein TZS69_000554 [Streptococcus suis]|nr:hypothetical protein [Streptococcus suis]